MTCRVTSCPKRENESLLTIRTLWRYCFFIQRRLFAWNSRTQWRYVARNSNFLRWSVSETRRRFHRNEKHPLILERVSPTLLPFDSLSFASRTVEMFRKLEKKSALYFVHDRRYFRERIIVASSVRRFSYLFFSTFFITLLLVCWKILKVQAKINFNCKLLLYVIHEFS